MAFNTAGFLFLFFPAAFLLYRLMPGRRTKNVFLAIASAVFYGFGGLASLPVLFAAFLWDYLFGRLIAKDEKRAKLWCGIAAAGNLALLGFYKYLAFVLETLHLPRFRSRSRCRSAFRFSRSTAFPISWMCTASHPASAGGRTRSSCILRSSPA